MPFKVAIVNPPPRNESDKHWARFPLLGIAYLASSMIKSGHEVKIFDGKLSALTCEEISSSIISYQPDLICITCMTVEFPMVKKLASMFKDNALTPIAVGGAHINAVGIDALRECSYIDYICVGEGEYLINDLIEEIQHKSNMFHINGLGYRLQGQAFLNVPRDYPDDYDLLPFPQWDLFEHVEQIPVLTHRGCPFKCTFCGHNSGFKPRYRSTDNVLDEIEFDIKTYRPKVIRFEDETFGLNMNRTKRILNGIIERGFNKFVTFSAQTRVDRIDDEFITLLKKAGFDLLELGVESGNEKILKDVKKGITLSQVRRAVSLSKKYKLKVWCKFILGHPGETLATMRDTVRFIVDINPDQLSVSIMTPFPGTPIYDMAVRGEGGYRMIGNDWGSFDKYSEGVLELEDISISKLKLYQITCYLALYLFNNRMFELLKLAWKSKAIVIEMVRGLFVSATVRVFNRRVID